MPLKLCLLHLLSILYVKLYIKHLPAILIKTIDTFILEIKVKDIEEKEYVCQCKTHIYLNLPIVCLLTMVVIGSEGSVGFILVVFVTVEDMVSFVTSVTVVDSLLEATTDMDESVVPKTSAAFSVKGIEVDVWGPICVVETKGGIVSISLLWVTVT